LEPGLVPASTVALTLDDGPDPETTPGVLGILDDYGAKASFFCIGDRVRRFAYLAAGEPTIEFAASLDGKNGEMIRGRECLPYARRTNTPR
jgi:hypothetical protein